MAFDWSKLNFFSRLDARARIFVLLFGVVGAILLVYLVVRFFFGGPTTTGASAVANVPQGMTSIPGSTVSPEYSRSLEEARNLQARQAQISGTSAIPTLINPGQLPTAPAQPTQSCTVVCAEQDVVNYKLDDWVKQGQVAPDVASSLEQLASNNVPVSQYAAELDRLVKAGKLTPEQARQLLDVYRRQHTNALLQQSAALMDPMIKSGDLQLGVANGLLDLQRQGATTTQYGSELERLVAGNKLSANSAQRLLAQFTQQCVDQSIKENVMVLQQMASKGEITTQVAADLTALSKKNVSVTDYSNALKADVTQGKLTPAAATKLIITYNQYKSICGAIALISRLIEQAEADAFKEITDLLAAKQITPDVASQLTTLIKNHVSFADYQAAVNNLMQQNKLTPDIAKRKQADYLRVTQLRALAQILGNLQANNASMADYTDALKRAVQAGLISPDEATRLLSEYQASTMKAPTVAAANTPEGQALANLQAGLQQNVPQPTSGQFTAAQAQAAAENAQERQARIQALMQAMQGQSAQLISSWNPPNTQERVGSYQIKTVKTEVVTGPPGGGPPSEIAPPSPVLIKGGTVLFAVLDTAVNSDYPDTPIMATIVTGKFQGARLLGKVITTKGVSGQLDRVALTFTMMNFDAWDRSKSINAFAIDPDTARTVIASSVNYHYLQRFGAIMATSFLQGFANAILTSGSTQTTGIFGTSSTHPVLSTSQKIWAGFGQVGQTIGQGIANYINRPPTVRVDSGVSLGILFMTDVSV